MSSKITIKPNPGVGSIGLITILAGLIMIIVGGSAWGMVASQLASENITVSADSKFLANKNVNDPLSAFAQAAVIEQHALEMTGGKTYAQLDADDPMRETVMNASFLRASLFTSVVAFGVSLFVIASGMVMIVIGWSLRRLAGGPPVVVETSADGPVNVVGTGGKPVLRKPTVLDPGLAEQAPVLAPLGLVSDAQPTESSPSEDLPARDHSLGADQVGAVTPEPPTAPAGTAEQAIPAVGGQPVRTPVGEAIARAEQDPVMPTPFPGTAAMIESDSEPVDEPEPSPAPRNTEFGNSEFLRSAPVNPASVQSPAPSRSPERAPGTGTIPIVSAVSAAEVDLTKPDPGVGTTAVPDAGSNTGQTSEPKPATGAKGWSSPADRLPKDS